MLPCIPGGFNDSGAAPPMGTTSAQEGKKKVESAQAASERHTNNSTGTVHWELFCGDAEYTEAEIEKEKIGLWDMAGIVLTKDFIRKATRGIDITSLYPKHMKKTTHNFVDVYKGSDFILNTPKK